MKKLILTLTVLGLVSSCTSTSSQDRDPAQIYGNYGKDYAEYKVKHPSDIPGQWAFWGKDIKPGRCSTGPTEKKVLVDKVNSYYKELFSNAADLKNFNRPICWLGHMIAMDLNLIGQRMSELKWSDERKLNFWGLYQYINSNCHVNQELYENKCASKAILEM